MANNRVFQAFHGGATGSTANVNGVANGGRVSGTINYGKDNVITSAGDGLQLPEVNTAINFVRGNVTSEDWPTIIALINGTVGTYVWHERDSASATNTVTVNTITKPIIHQASLSLNNFSPATIDWGFECRATAADDTLADMWAILPLQIAPATSVESARGDQITAATLGGAAINHVSGVTLSITGNLIKGIPGEGDA